jgi:hypothetical protein
MISGNSRIDSYRPVLISLMRRDSLTYMEYPLMQIPLQRVLDMGLGNPVQIVILK